VDDLVRSKPVMSEDVSRILQQALRHHGAGDLPSAEKIYRQVLAKNPNHPDALHLLGVIAHQVGRHADAVNLIAAAIRHNPKNPDFHINLGEALSALGRLDDAIVEYRAAIQLNPREVIAWSNLAAAFLAQEKLEEAVEASRKALSIKPDDRGASANLGIGLTRQGQFDEAIAVLSRAAKMNSRSAQAHTNLGMALLAVNRLQESIAASRTAISIDANYALAHNNLGAALQQAGFVDEAVAAYRRAIELNPRYAVAHDNLLLALHYVSAVSSAENFNAHQQWSNQFIPANYIPPAHENDRNSDRPIRIGFVSGDFRRHSVAYFIEPLLREFDRSQFEITCYSSTPIPDEVTERLRTLARWSDIRGMTDDHAAELIRGDKIDILVDLAGHTAGNRLMVFARKPAPIQVTYLGYPNTTGLKAMDYRMTDSIADPVDCGSDSFHAESLFRLPRCAWCYLPPQDAPPVTSSARTEINFASFNTFAKLSSEILNLWSKVLQNVPASRLLLKGHGTEDAAARARILEIVGGNNVDPSRITFLGRQSTPQLHLQMYNDVDIALDTHPYHGTTTTCDALWMGVPVVTLAGDRHVSRVGASLLTAAGLEELIATTPQQYVDIASALASDRERLAELRGGLRERMQASPLMDAASLAREMERAFRSMFLAWCSR
jgi:protein O-GlcNAc transferase